MGTDTIFFLRQSCREKASVSILFLALVFLIYNPTAGHAQLLMEKSRVELTVAPGQTVSDSMAIHNTSGKPVTVKVYWQDFVYKPPFYGKKDFLPRGTSKYSMDDWINFSPTEFVLAPHSRREIRYVIKVPENASGGHYGVLFFEQEAAAEQTGKVVRIVTRLGSLFFLELTDKDKTAVIDHIHAGENALLGSISNRGNVFLFSKGVYYILDQKGVVADRGELKKIYLPPEETAEFSIEIPKDIAPGTYTAVLTFDLGEGKSVVKEIDFTRDAAIGTAIVQVRD